MFDERAYVARLESAGTEELVNMLARPTADEEKALRVYLGDERYQRMHGLALRRGIRRAVDGPRGNVVVIPGIMGSELTAVDRGGDLDSIWVQVLRLMAGRLDRLRLGDDGRTEYDPNYDVRATGILKRYYGELQLTLSENWNVRAFWFDWRKDLDLAADELRARISSWFADDAPVHIVTHSMGGLVARTFIKNHPERWKAMWDASSNGKSGGRLIMLGTPNYGSFAIPQAITGAASMVRKLALLDVRHRLTGLLEILNSFVGSYQMLPSPFRMPGMEPLYDAKTYGDLNVPQSRLENALKHHESLQSVVDTGRMVYVAGYDQPTFGNINDFSQLNSLDAYDVTMKGDGTVPHELGLLSTPDGEKVKTYYVQEEHGNLASNVKILSGLDELLGTGSTAALSDRILTGRRGRREDESITKEDARRRLVASRDADEKRLQILMSRNSQRSAEPRADSYVSTDERKMEEILTRDFLSHDRREEQPEGEKVAPFGTASIEIGLVCGEIQDLPYEDIKSKKGGYPVDALSVGHYINVKPQEAELALDQAISQVLSGKVEVPDGESVVELPEADLLLTQYFERGIIRGRLGQPFFLPDPRSAGDGKGERVIAIAGMGLPGGFGVPELAVLARELCWSLGRMEKRHLATVLIGSGKGNLSGRDAISAWMRGIKNAITGSFEDETRRLVRVTFVESDPYKIEDIEEAILGAKRSLEEWDRLKLDYQGPVREDLEQRKEEERRRRQAESPDERDDEPDDRVPTRITLSLKGNTYRFGAITESASIPEREIPLDPDLVMSANDELASEPDPFMQSERGRFLEKLLVPAELRAQFSTNAPLVMMLDSTIARIHWEMVAQPDPYPRSRNTSAEGAGAESLEFDPDLFLGASRGFTRQLRTTLAPPPEPPPPPRRILRVLVIADPAEDAHLPGAEEEGVEVADLFERFNAVYEESSYNRVEVVRLFGPYEATRITVLRHLMLHSYDVLHFAGHCVYDAEHPESSGWIFSRGKRLSANELSRIDRVPSFVFSNACESGITPDRSEMRSVELAPSFAEQFFHRGVTNFVCTAWPVDDVAAREFALTLYGNLLGLSRVDDQGTQYDATDPRPMHAAMREARLAVAGAIGGTRTWGAYQHYGSPYFRFFDPVTMYRNQSASGNA